MTGAGRNRLYALRRWQLSMSGVSVGAGTTVAVSARLRRNGNLQIGRDCTIGRLVELAPQGGSIIIGNYCSINDFGMLYGAGGVVIGRGVRIATGAIIVASEHVFARPDMPIHSQGISAQGVYLEDDIWLGARVVVLDGVRIGRGAVIGAGAVVTRDIPAMVVAAGVPARVLHSR